MTKIEAFEAAIIDWVEAKERLHLATVGYEAARVEREDAVTAYAMALGLVDGARAAVEPEDKRTRLKPGRGMGLNRMVYPHGPDVVVCETCGAHSRTESQGGSVMTGDGWKCGPCILGRS